MKDVHITFVSGSNASKDLLEMIGNAYRQTYGTSPGTIGRYAVLWHHGSVLGCVGMQEANAEGTFLIERIYALDRERLAVRIDDTNTMEFGRLVANDSRATPLLLYAGAWYGMRHGKMYGLIEHSAAVHRVLRRFGIRFLRIECGPARLEAVPEEDRSYYAKQKMRPYIANLMDVTEALRSHITPDLLQKLFG